MRVAEKQPRVKGAGKVQMFPWFLLLLANVMTCTGNQEAASTFFPLATLDPKAVPVSKQSGRAKFADALHGFNLSEQGKGNLI